MEKKIADTSRGGLIRIIFMGTSSFAVPVLEICAAHQNETWGPFSIRIVGVFTQPDRPVGRKGINTPPPIKESAIKLGLPVYQPDSIHASEWIEKIAALSPDIIIVAAFGQIIPKKILDIPKYDSINIHASLLPRWRGAAPIQHAILAGDSETGISLMLMDEKLDHGPIIMQTAIPIKKDETAPELESRLKHEGAKMLDKMLPEWILGNLKPKDQDESLVTHARSLRREDGRLLWDKTAEELAQQIRAFTPWPGSWALWEKEDNAIARLEIVRADAHTDDTIEKPFGMTISEGDSWKIITGKGTLIPIRVKLEGKKEVTARDFIRGYPGLIGSILK